MEEGKREEKMGENKEERGKKREGKRGNKKKKRRKRWKEKKRGEKGEKNGKKWGKPTYYINCSNLILKLLCRKLVSFYTPGLPYQYSNSKIADKSTIL